MEANLDLVPYMEPMILSSNSAKSTDDWQYQQEGFSFKRSDVKYVHLPLQDMYHRITSDGLLVRLLEILPPGVVIAGGYVAALVNDALHNASDVDLFFTGPGGDVLAETTQRLLAAGYIPNVESKCLFYRTTNRLRRGTELNQEAYISFRPGPLLITTTQLHVQAIKIAWFESAEHVIDSFDFTATQFAIDVGTKELVFNPVAFADYTQGRLVIHNREGDRPLQKRIQKYIAKGFKPHGFTYQETAK